jgi:hypothetical protein
MVISEPPTQTSSNNRGMIRPLQGRTKLTMERHDLSNPTLHIVAKRHNTDGPFTAALFVSAGGLRPLVSRGSYLERARRRPYKAMGSAQDRHHARREFLASGTRQRAHRHGRCAGLLPRYQNRCIIASVRRNPPQLQYHMCGDGRAHAINISNWSAA